MKSLNQRCLLLVCASLFLTGCDFLTPPPQEGPLKLPPERWEYRYKGLGKLMEKDIVLLGREKGPVISEALWYGALETLRDFPMKIIDGAGGVLQTDWHVLPAYPHERFQVRVAIQPSQGIDVQALKVMVIRQVFQRKQWESAPSSEILGNTIKHDILLNARTYAVSGKRAATP